MLTLDMCGPHNVVKWIIFHVSTSTTGYRGKRNCSQTPEESHSEIATGIKL